MGETESRLFARQDPKGFLRRCGGPAVFDELQRVPELFSYIQTAVDNDDSPGRLVLTGSHNFLLREELYQTLAGRAAVLHLLPFSRAELEDQSQQEPRDPRHLFSNPTTKLRLWEAITTGFHPRIHDRGIPPAVWLADYVQTSLIQDLRGLVTTADLETFEGFLKLTAGRIGQLLNDSSPANDCGIAVDTARRWLSVLTTSFVILLVQPHHRNYNKRLIRSPTLYFYDTGLACYLLGIRDARQLEAHPLGGALFAGYVVAEAAKAYLHHRRTPPLYFWRDRTGQEVDLLIEEATQLYPVEIKSSATMSENLSAPLRWWCAQAERPQEAATLAYGGSDAFVRSGVAVRPWYCV